MPTAPDRRFDVAVSFLAADEPFALQLREQLEPALSVFVYSKAQEDLAGRDGVEAFRDVFRAQSNLAVVLHSQGWGETPWTRVEATAIKDRCLADGWPHLFVVRLDRSGLPPWVPDSHLYFDPATFNMRDLIGAIKARSAEVGAPPRKLTAVQRAEAMARREQFDRETEDLLARRPQQFDECFGEIGQHLAEKAAAIAVATNRKVVADAGEQGSFVYRDHPITLLLLPQERYANSAQRASILVQCLRGAIRTLEEAQRGAFVLEKPTLLAEETALFIRLPELGWCWEWRGRVLPPAEVADALIEAVLERRESIRRKRR